MSTLYRDYRPQNFEQVLGQNHIKITLQNELEHDRLAQAYLFCGPRAVGKTTLARVLAKAVNCEKRSVGSHEPCNECAACLSITGGKNLDVVEIDAASNTGVDNVRENIIAFSRLAPGSAKFKVFIIDEVHMLSLSAFNALLKIIEEPPAYVIFILCTTEVQKVPNTIISRCERYDFKRISIKEIVKKLSMIAKAEKVAVEANILESVARRSGGHLRDAESLLGQILSLGDKQITSEQAELVIPHYNSHEAVDLLGHLSRKDAAKAIALINKLADSGVNIKIFTGEVIGLLRQIILNKLSPELAGNLGLDLGESLEKSLSQVGEGLSWEELMSFSQRFIEVFNDNRSTVVAQLPLELAIVQLCLNSGSALNSGGTQNSVRPMIDQAGAPFKNITKTAPSKPTLGAVAEKNDAPVINQALINLSVDQVEEKWPEFLVKLKKYNHSLSFVLQNCRPQEIKNNELCLIFKYKFHQDRINDASIKGIVETTLAEVFGSAVSFHSSIDETLDLRRAVEPSMGAAAEEDISDGLVMNNKHNSPHSSSAAPDSQPAGGLVVDLLKNFGGEIIS